MGQDASEDKVRSMAEEVKWFRDKHTELSMRLENEEK